MRKILLLISGLLATGLGIIGIFLPLLPTTPFLLLAAFLFSRSSDRLHNWLLKSKYLAEYINHYRNGGGVSRSIKIRSISFLWFFLILAMILSGNPWIVLLLLLVGGGVTAHIISLR